MIGIGISPLFKRGGGGMSYGAYTTAFNTQVLANGGSLTPSELSALTLFETSMGADMAEFDRLWIHGLSNQIAARISFVNPTSTAITEVNSPTWTAYEGYTGNGTSAYLDSNFSLAYSSVKYTQNSASIGFYSRNNIGSENSVYMGGTSGVNVTYCTPYYSILGSLFTINAGSNTILSGGVTTTGLLASVRTGANLNSGYRNGVSVISDTISSQALTNYNLFILCRSVANSPSLFTSNQISLSFIGSGAINQSNFYNSVQTLGTSLGWIPNVGPYTNAFNNAVISNGGSLTNAELSALSTFESSVGSDMAEFDRLWIHGLSNQVAARTSFVNPTSALITEVNSPTFTPFVGYTGNGSTSYLDTNFNPSTNGIKYTLNNASHGVYSRVTAYFCAIGLLDTNGGNKISRIYPNYYGTYIIYSNNQAGDTLSASYSTNYEKGLLSAVRLSSNNVKYYRNGSQLLTDTTANSGLGNLNIFLLGCNYNGNLTEPGAYNISMSHIGSGNINQSNFYNATQTLGTSLGWAV